MKLCLLGAPPDSGNLGVSALMTAVLSGVHQRRPEAQITVFDNGLGVREGRVRTPTGEVVYQRIGLRLSKRVHLRESLANMRVSSWFGGLGNPGVEAIAQANAALDISGGDSFADLYGPRRFRQVAQPKELVLRHGTPLILLPQTYGPFDDPRRRDRAAAIIVAAAQAWARDADSFERLTELVDSSFDAARHHSGVDVTFAMDPIEPAEALPDRLVDWLAADRSRPVAGINVSGLLHNDDVSGQFGLRVDYRELIGRLVRRLLDETDARIVLVPHVRGAGGESDDTAVQAVARALDTAQRDRVEVVTSELGAAETKWVISQLDWFCGTRMHATIAALSTGVPVCAIAYSLKTRGVFDSCDLAEGVVDARALATDAALAGLWDSWNRREETRTHLAASVPATVTRAHQQMDHIVAACGGG